MQTNVNNNKTKKGIIQSQAKSKASLPYYVYEMRQMKKQTKALKEKKITSRHIQGVLQKSIFNFEGQYPTFCSNKNYEIYTNKTPQ